MRKLKRCERRAPKGESLRYLWVVFTGALYPIGERDGKSFHVK